MWISSCVGGTLTRSVGRLDMQWEQEGRGRNRSSVLRLSERLSRSHWRQGLYKRIQSREVCDIIKRVKIWYVCDGTFRLSRVKTFPPRSQVFISSDLNSILSLIRSLVYRRRGVWKKGKPLKIEVRTSGLLKTTFVTRNLKLHMVKIW
jgi:histone acetyltransferase (RNA polymerase elongator complex component)